MKALLDAGGAGGSRSHFAHLESMLQDLSRCEERSNLQSVERASVRTRQRLLKDQLLQVQEELVTAQASKAKLCEEIGALQQTKEHQAKQLANFEVEIQSSREAQAALVKTMEGLEESTWKVKQQYIRSLACRMKTAALLLHQLHAVKGVQFNVQLAQKCNEWVDVEPNKRKRVLEDANVHTSAVECGNKTEPADSNTRSRAKSNEAAPHHAVQAHPKSLSTAKETDETMEESAASSPESIGCTKRCLQCDRVKAQSEHTSAQLRSQVSQCEAKCSALDEQHKALIREHSALLAEKKATAQIVVQRDAQIEELVQKLESSLSKQQADTESPPTFSGPDQDSSEFEGRLKILEENLAQMNGYADQLELVIAQCPTCTIKLQQENTQDAADKAG